MEEPLTAIEANRRLFRKLASDYDRTELCVASARHQRRLRAALAEALAIVPQKPRVLDACGGSGNVAQSLARQGLVPTVVDVSPEMVAQWRSKCHELGVEADVHVAPIEEFLRTDERTWDLIVFSSALHHLDDPGAVLEAAAARLGPRGAILTIFDPTQADRTVRIMRLVDWLGYLLIDQPGEFLTVVRRRVAGQGRRVAAGVEPHVGRTAERYALSGIDDFALRRKLEDCHVTVLVHERFVDARLAMVRLLLRIVRRSSAFRLLVQKPDRRDDVPG